MISDLYININDIKKYHENSKKIHGKLDWRVQAGLIEEMMSDALDTDEGIDEAADEELDKVNFIEISRFSSIFSQSESASQLS